MEKPLEAQLVNILTSRDAARGKNAVNDVERGLFVELVCLSVCLSVCGYVTFVFFYGLRELYEADFLKPGICGSGRVWANVLDVLHLTSS